MLDKPPAAPGRAAPDTAVVPAKSGSTAQPPSGSPPPHQPYAPENETHLLDRIAVLYRYRRIALSVFVLASAAMMIQGFTTVPMYQAKATIEIKDERSTAVPGMNEVANQYYEDPEPYYNTQYKILKGRDLARKVVKKLHLDQVAEFNGTGPQPTTPVTVVTGLKDRVFGLIGQSSTSEHEAPRFDETSDESALVSAFLGRVEVLPDRRSRLVDVLFTSRDAPFAAKASNALVDEYVDQNLQLRVQTIQNMLDWLGTQVTTQAQKVTESERQLAEYRDKKDAMSLDDKNNIVASRLNHLNDELTRTKTDRIQKESLYNQLKTMQGSTAPDAIPAIAQNAQVQAAKLKLDSLRAERLRLTEKYGDKHPQVRANIDALQEAQAAYAGELQRAMLSVENDYRTASLTERTLSANLQAAKAEVQDLGRKSVDYNVMEREAKSNRSVYESLLQQQNQYLVQRNSNNNNVRIVEHAEIPKGPVSPAGRRTWLMSLAVGLVLAIAVAFGLDYMNDTIKTPEDVTKRLKLPFLGLVPSVRGDKHPVLASSHVPHDFGEAFRSLRTSLMARYPGDGTKLMIVTSAQPLEGKTTTAANIAMALAYGGSRVLLVDADMRRPGLHRPLRLTNERGLSQVLIGQARVRDVIQRTVDPNLLAITAGRTPPNPSELLSSERMKTLLTNLSHGPFDWIVIDTPPVLAVTDAVILAPVVNGVTFVVGAEMTRRRLAERALETILQTHPRFTAVVLNKVDFARNKYYYSRYYGHQYKNYYAEAAV